MRTLVAMQANFGMGCDSSHNRQIVRPVSIGPHVGYESEIFYADLACFCFFLSREDVGASLQARLPICTPSGYSANHQCGTAHSFAAVKTENCPAVRLLKALAYQDGECEVRP